ncbi:transcriptional regulator, MarR family [Clostridium amylolyticum]|uniref:Transcriptional regulator, MarR family n=1 Tax=Clostridium amylolyticum TaxID=1121298 RepID=A0A1M6EJV9_9CLOT|nr:MarR family transcriptional regulator [Clostridium amylolyticum]SHI85568.1 transcriptional regulator, MarR family [Clostridium amylolyticum]
MNDSCDSIGKYISILYRLSGTYFAREFKKLNIGSGQYMFLAFLYNHEGINQEELSNYLSIDKGTTAKALKKLEDEGYISRVQDEKDRRAYRVFITPKGMSIKEEFFSILRGWNDNLINELKPEEIQTLKTLLKKLILLNIQEDFHG